MSARRGRGARTVLEELIWARRWTLDEFAAYVERFAREHGERATLSRRHLDRLVAGSDSQQRPVGRPNLATARLLERIFGIGIDELLSEPADAEPAHGDGELRERITNSAQVDASILRGFHDRLTAVRRVDRESGARVARAEVRAALAQAIDLHGYSMSPGIRSGLAEIVTEFATLAGWQCLDLGQLAPSWEHYERAKAAARECGDSSFAAHTAAEQAYVLLDLGYTRRAVELFAGIRAATARSAAPVLCSWLAAAYGEALAAQGDHAASARAFDDAALRVPAAAEVESGPYVALDPVHLARWRGHALARSGAPEAVAVLESALGQLDPTFIRAATALRVDLATACSARRELEQAKHHLDAASASAEHIGSRRQLRRIRQLAAQLRSGR